MQYLWLKLQVGKNFDVLWQFFMGYLYDPPKKSKYQRWYWTPCCGLEVQNPTQTLKSVKGSGNTLIKSPSGKELFRPLAIFHGIFIGTPKKSKYLTTCCGLEVQNPTKALKSVKGSDNTIGLNPKCERSLRPLAIFHGIFIGSPKIQITKLIFDNLLWAWGAESHPRT